MEGRPVSRQEALQYRTYKHACHAMLYAASDEKLFGKIPIRNVVLMQMRFDGRLGFPGGFVDPEAEGLEAGLCRELLEELGCPVELGEQDYLSSHAYSSQHLVTHFYTKSISLEQLRDIERAALSAKDHGLEVMGMVRVPLFTLRDGVGGLPAFLSNCFIGNARCQLVDALRSLRLVREDWLVSALKLSHH